MTFREIVLRARHLIAEPDEGFLTNEEFMDWINDCHIDLAMRLPMRALRLLQTTSDWDITTATFTITVTNDGTEVLNTVVVSDPESTSCGRTVAQTEGLYAGNTFDPGESFTYTCTKQM